MKENVNPDVNNRGWDIWTNSYIDVKTEGILFVVIAVSRLITRQRNQNNITNKPEFVCNSGLP